MKHPLSDRPRVSRRARSRRTREPWLRGPFAIVGGCGHVGLPLGIAFAQRGCQVDLVDLWDERVRQVNAGQMPFFEEGADELLPRLVRTGMIKATTDRSVIEDASAVIITIATPAGKNLDLRVVTDMLPQLRPGQLVILRSTVPAGTTDHLAAEFERCDRRDIDLSYCPERIVQGRSLLELAELPQLVAGVTARAARRAASLFRLVAPKILVLRPMEAELAKLFCNAYRYINFAISNQFYMLAQHHRADFLRVYEALRDEYPRMQAFARSGFAAGPCLVKDTVHLGSNCDDFVLGRAALEINEGLPEHVVRRLRTEYPLHQMVVGILGMAFKPECDDPRDSLSYRLRDLLRAECRQVLCTDPFVRDPELVELSEVLHKSELLVVGTPHQTYRNLRVRQPIVDLSGTLGAEQIDRVPRKPARRLRSKQNRNGRMPCASKNGKPRVR